MKSSRYVVIIFLIIALCLTSYAPSFALEKLCVAVSILPLAEFVEQLGKGRVDVMVMVPPGASPHTYEPQPSQLKALNNAKIYVKVGTGIEFELVWLDKLISINKGMYVCDSSKGIRVLEMESGKGHDRDHHRHHEETDPHRATMDPHIWLSPKNAILMVKNITDALIERDPENKAFYIENAGEYVLRLKTLDMEIRKRFSSKTGLSFICLHPAWGYFAHDYGLNQIPVSVQGKEPSAKDLVSMIETAKQMDIKIIFASPQFSRKSAEVVSTQIEGRVVLVDPLAKGYIENLDSIADEFSMGLR